MCEFGFGLALSAHLRKFAAVKQRPCQVSQVAKSLVLKLQTLPLFECIRQIVGHGYILDCASRIPGGSSKDRNEVYKPLPLSPALAATFLTTTSASRLAVSGARCKNRFGSINSISEQINSPSR